MTRITFLDGLAQSSKNLSLSFRMNHQGYIPQVEAFQKKTNLGLSLVSRGLKDEEVKQHYPSKA